MWSFLLLIDDAAGKGQHIRALRPPGSEVPADPENSENGQTGRNLETPGFSRLHASPGKVFSVILKIAS